MADARKGPRPVGSRDVSDLLRTSGELRQELLGFDPDYADIVDYIVRCTHKIWEEKGVGLIYTHYRQPCVIRTPDRLILDRETVVQDTIKHLAAFPDRKLQPVDVIWTDLKSNGFYSSHQLVSVGRNTGDTEFGPPTNRKVVVRTVADCIIKENRIYEEWLVRDGMSTVVQLGLDPFEVARRRAQASLDAGTRDWMHGEIERVQGQRSPLEDLLPGIEDAKGKPEPERARYFFNAIWNARLFNLVREVYAPGVEFHGPAGRELTGDSAVIGYMLSLCAALPDIAFSVDHAIANVQDNGDAHVALRWTAAGTHDGYGAFGEPAQARVYLLGVCHQKWRGGRIVEELFLFDELAALTQIERQRLGGKRAPSGFAPTQVVA